MTDKTLLDSDIRKEATKGKLLSRFSEESLKGASYDIRAGDTAILIEPEPPKGRGRVYINLKQQGSISIPPEHSCTLHSLEEINMPDDMQGFLFNRTHWVVQRLNYDGGVINPGYRGLLFITVTNLGDSPVKIRYGEALVSAVFIRLDKPAEKLRKEFKKPRRRLLEEELPPLPAGKRYDTVELSKRIKALEDSVKKYGPLIAFTQSFVESVLFGSLAGIIAGIVVVVFPRVPSPWNWGMAIFSALIIAFIWLFSSIARVWGR